MATSSRCTTSRHRRSTIGPDGVSVGLIRGERGTQRVNVDRFPIVAPLRLRRRSMASLVRIGGDQMWVELNTQPPVVRSLTSVSWRS